MSSKRLVLCFGPSVFMQGGISSHIERLLELSDAGQLEPYRIVAVSTVAGGSRVQKIAMAISTVASLPFMLISAKAVYINSATHYSWYRKGAIAILSSLFRKPVFMQLHGGALGCFLAQQGVLGRFFSRAVFRSLTCALVITDEHCMLARNWGARCVERLDNFSLSPGVLRDSFFERDSIKITYVGGLLKEKGVFELIDAMKLLAVRGVRFTLDCVGDGPERSALELRCKELSLDKVVFFHGWVKSGLVLDVLKEQDVLVLPSYFEAQPLVVIEAMMSGCLVVASNVGDVSRMLANGECGYILDSISPSCIADTIESIARSGPSHVVVNAFNRAAVLFSAQAFAARFKEVFSRYGI